MFAGDGVRPGDGHGGDGQATQSVSCQYLQTLYPVFTDIVQYLLVFRDVVKYLLVFRDVKYPLVFKDVVTYALVFRDGTIYLLVSKQPQVCACIACCVA